jgi:hypothetical protein
LPRNEKLKCEKSFFSCDEKIVTDVFVVKPALAAGRPDEFVKKLPKL